MAPHTSLAANNSTLACDTVEVKAKPLHLGFINIALVNDSERMLNLVEPPPTLRIGWHMAMQGYLSKHWRLAISVNHHLEENNDKGQVWVRKTVMLLWDFANKM
jgi:hypothetical protein